MLFIGNRLYKNLKLDNIIDTFSENTRFNLSQPNLNNGTKTYNYYFNSHVGGALGLVKKGYMYSVNSHINLDPYKKNVTDEYLNIVLKNFNLDNYNKVYWIKSKDKRKLVKKYNKILLRLKCPHKFGKIQPRIGMIGVLDYVSSCPDKAIFIVNFSLTKSDNIPHLYSNRTISNIFLIHDLYLEINILKWLHNNNYIDATLCCLKDTDYPQLDCSVIYPTFKIISLLLSEYGIITLENYFNKDLLDNLINDIFPNNKYVASDLSSSSLKRVKIFRGSNKYIIEVIS